MRGTSTCIGKAGAGSPWGPVVSLFELSHHLAQLLAEHVDSPPVPLVPQVHGPQDDIVQQVGEDGLCKEGCHPQ